jgi:hypothetical protein
MPLDCDPALSLLGDTSPTGTLMILLHTMGGLPGGGPTYLCVGFGGMLADVNLRNGGLSLLGWSDWLAISPLTRLGWFSGGLFEVLVLWWWWWHALVGGL